MSLEWELGLNLKLESKNCVEESLEEVAGWSTPLVVVVSAPQLQLQFSTGNTAAARWTYHSPPFNAIAILNRQDSVLSLYPKNV